MMVTGGVRFKDMNSKLKLFMHGGGPGGLSGSGCLQKGFIISLLTINFNVDHFLQ